MGEEYGRELERVRKARADFEATQDEVERRKHEYFTSVRTLHEAGMPLREIATALGLSHQRVHQMVEEATGKKSASLRRRAARAAKQGGLAVLVILLATTGFFTLRPDLSPIAPISTAVTPGTERRVSAAPSPKTKPRDGRNEERHVPGYYSIDCARRIFSIHDKLVEAGLPQAKVEFVLKPTCDVVVVEPRTHDLEARIRRQMRRMTIEIRRRRA